jgi:hypothetical protein
MIGWSDATTTDNFKLALRGKAIDWFNYVNDTERKTNYARFGGA